MQVGRVLGVPEIRVQVIRAGGRHRQKVCPLRYLLYMMKALSRGHNMVKKLLLRYYTHNPLSNVGRGIDGHKKPRHIGIP